MPRRLLLAACALVIVPVFAACGDDDGGDDASALGSPATSNPANGSAAGPSPKLTAPAGKYSVSLEDIGNAWLTDIANTYVIDATTYGKEPMLFGSEAEGKKLLAEWGYLEGYETAYIPEGRDDTVLKGGYYIKVETHLFEDAAGAQKAFAYFSEYAGTSGATPVTIKPVGNGWVAFTFVAGTIANKRVNAVFHQIVFFRGNVLSIILTKGAQGFMQVDSAWELAKIADDKLLGERAAPEPTRTSNFKTPTPAPKP